VSLAARAKVTLDAFEVPRSVRRLEQKKEGRWVVSGAFDATVAEISSDHSPDTAFIIAR
jgi:Leu/Phe-tRNA-protein transferase